MPKKMKEYIQEHKMVCGLAILLLALVVWRNRTYDKGIIQGIDEAFYVSLKYPETFKVLATWYLAERGGAL